MKLELDKHQQNHYSLSEFEGDEIEDFEGYDVVERKAEKDADDMSWLFPARGPG